MFILFFYARAILVCKAPVSDYQQKYDTQMGAEGIAERKARGRRPYVGRTGETFQINYSMYEDELKYCDYKVYTHISIPTLIVHGGHDMDVPVEQSYKTAKLIPDCTLKVIDTADHGFTGVGEAEQAYAYFLEFITKHLVE